jgi:hypothetical protein
MDQMDIQADGDVTEQQQDSQTVSSGDYLLGIVID